MGVLLAVALAGSGGALAGDYARLHPDLRTLLATTAEGDSEYKTPFFRSLARLDGTPPAPAPEITRYISGMEYGSGRAITPLLARYESGAETGGSGRSTASFDTGRAAWLRTDAGRPVVAILATTPFSVPGNTLTQLVLFEGKGRLADCLACGINTRYGTLATTVLERRAADGADIVIRFVPNYSTPWHNWHTVTQAGKGYTFRALERNEPVDWAGLGLVRVAVERGKLRVVFPKLGNADAAAP